MSGETTSSSTPATSPSTPTSTPSAADVQVAHAQHVLAEMTGGRFVPSLAKPAVPAAPTTAEATRELMKTTASDLTLPKAVREARVAELRKSLATFDKPPATSTPASTTTEQPAPTLSKAEQLESRRRALNDPTSEDGIWSKDQAKRDAARAELRKILAQQSDAERPRAELSIENKRAEFGLRLPKFLNEETAASFDVDAEAEALDYAHAQGIEAAVVRDAMGDYFKLAEMRDGPIDDATLDQLEAKYQKRGVPKEVTAAYRRWLRENDFM
jgi:hypothetical protein